MRARGTAKRFVRGALGRLGFEVVRRGRRGDPVVLENVWRSSHGRRALVSYLRVPFVTGLTRSHTNVWECHTAAEALGALGYRVDVAEWDGAGLRPADYAAYDVVYGFGEPMERSFYAPEAERLFRVYYGTGCSPVYSSRQSARRLAEVHERTGLWMPGGARLPDRAWPLQMALADVLIALGNEWVLATYEADRPRGSAHALAPFYFDVHEPDLRARTPAEARRHFLWFGSTGAVHKGLDLLVEWFAARPDLHLHVCGPPSPDRGFRARYGAVMERAPNVSDHGFIPLESDVFRAVVGRCAATIYPTASEGGSPALLNVIANGGLLPLVPVSVGVDLGGHEVPIGALSVEGVGQAVEAFLALSADEVHERAAATTAYVRARYTYAAYRANLHALLAATLPAHLAR